MAFFQDPPRLGNQWEEDRVVRGFLARKLPGDAYRAAEPDLAEMGALAAGRLRDLLLAEPDAKPSLVSWDAWGRRVDRITLAPLWRETARLAAERGSSRSRTGGRTAASRGSCRWRSSTSWSLPRASIRARSR